MAGNLNKMCSLNSTTIYHDNKSDSSIFNNNNYNTSNNKSNDDSKNTAKIQQKNAFQIRLKLIECQAVTPQEFMDAACYLRPQDYQDIVMERSLDHMCGYPICSCVLMTTRKGRYKVSLSQRKVFDIRGLKSFCTSECATASDYYMGQLSKEPVYMRNEHHGKPIYLWNSKQGSNER